MKNNIGTYFEIAVTEMDRAVSFYSFVFNCKFEKESIHQSEMALFSYNDSGLGITGALAKGESYTPSLAGSLIYLSTADIDSSMSKIKEKGGHELFPKTKVHNIGFTAEFKDSEGNRIGLFQGI